MVVGTPHPPIASTHPLPPPTYPSIRFRSMALPHPRCLQANKAAVGSLYNALHSSGRSDFSQEEGQRAVQEAVQQVLSGTLH